MREGILNQLPKTLPKEKVVLVVGPDDFRGLNQVKSLIETMNRGGEWIRGEFRAQVPESQVSARVGVVLTMVATNHGTLSNMRRAAKQAGACCPNQALTIGEVKDIIGALADIRNGAAQTTAPPVEANGNGLHPVLNGAAQYQHRSDTVDARLQPVALQENEVPTPTADQGDPKGESEESEELDSALTALDSFGIAFAEAQDAVLRISDRMRGVIEQRDKLQLALTAKEEEIAGLRELVDKMADLTGKNTALAAQNKELQGEVSRLQGALDNLDSLIKGARAPKK